ncbi:hypothetical protein AVEN_147863-1 [Araneus ventricosus]|uniref:RNase H type-1 domain-containing protein n=1 Tax=Araneus ventricosus TaxID=182803 RepID=A0A4Y2V4N6_ARAVE|nr:hypothetical protein AVEN_257013-1 [Araneus ventricosus]GBO18687.1 hypothetical protein AVEN_147863-1 [Araneus ventricosus]
MLLKQSLKTKKSKRKPQDGGRFNDFKALWIPSHANIQDNEIADALAKAGADDASVPSAPLTYLELFSRAKSKNKTI